MGFVDFVGTSTTQYISFNLTYRKLNNGSFGIVMPLSASPGPIIRNYGFAYFYVQKLGCYFNYYFEVSNYTCIECTIMPHCLTCSSLTVCTQCYDGYQLGVGNLTCDQVICLEPHCILCNVPSICLQCDTVNGYILQPNGTCIGAPNPPPPNNNNNNNDEALI